MKKTITVLSSVLIILSLLSCTCRQKKSPGNNNFHNDSTGGSHQDTLSLR